MASIRVDNGIRKIEVNDAGEYISLSLSDPGLFDRLGCFLGWLEEKKTELQRFDDEMDAAGGSDLDRVLAVSRKTKEVYEGCVEQLDSVFGPETCRKVFGEGVIPDSEMIFSFLDQLSPILEEMAKERADRLIKSKYGRSRSGAIRRV